MPPGIPDPVDVRRKRIGLGITGLVLFAAGGVIGGILGVNQGELTGRRSGYQEGIKAATPSSAYVAKSLRPCGNSDVITVDSRKKHYVFLEEKGKYTRSDLLQQQQADELEKRTLQFLTTQPGYKPAQ